MLTFALGALAAAPGKAQTYGQFFVFSDAGDLPFGPAYPTNMIEAWNGQLYSTAFEYPGGEAAGAIYALSTSAVESVVYDVPTGGTQGTYCDSGVNQGTDGNAYAVCQQGGTGTACSNYCGTVYRVSGGTAAILHNFQGGADGANPYGPMIQASDGNYYGITQYGGSSACASGCGTIFKITSAGAYSVFHRFQNTASDGYGPQPGLVQGADGALYGAVNLAATGGAIFRMTLAGQISYIHKFTATVDNSCPNGGLTLGSNGALYGTTPGSCAADAFENGTIYRLTDTGAFTQLHAFTGPSGDGANPIGGMIQATDGNFYGVTMGTNPAGDGGAGSLYKMTPAGVVTLLHTFDYVTDFSNPLALVQHTNGTIYGAAANNNCITGECTWGGVFTLGIGAKAFVKLQSTSGAPGAEVNMIGPSLNAATAVDFDGTAAAFTIASPTQIVATVPAGAASGFVTVTVHGQTLKSSWKFTVK